MWIGIGDLEHWVVNSHSRNMGNLMSVVRGTQDYNHGDNAYRVLVVDTPTPDRVYFFVGCHYSKSKASSGWEDNPQAKRHRKW